jgi:hypothetical protein
MKAEKRAIFLFVALVFGQWLLPEPARAADEQQPQEGAVEVRNFTFRDGERLTRLPDRFYRHAGRLDRAPKLARRAAHLMSRASLHSLFDQRRFG